MQAREKAVMPVGGCVNLEPPFAAPEELYARYARNLRNIYSCMEPYRVLQLDFTLEIEVLKMLFLTDV